MANCYDIKKIFTVFLIFSTEYISFSVKIMVDRSS